MNNFEQNIILIGGKPGSGKSRLGREMATAMGVLNHSAEHFSIGDHVRRIGSGAIASSDRGHVLRHLNEQPYNLLDDEIIANILNERLAQSAARLLFIDGLPRRESQIDVLRDAAVYNLRTINGLIVTEVSDEVAVMRLQRRALRDERNPVDPDTIPLRIQVHGMHFPAVVNAYKESGLPIEVIDTSGDKDATTQHGLMAVSWMLSGTNDTEHKNAS